MIELEKRQSLYCIGDKVTIRKRKYNKYDYLCTYIDDMTKYELKSAVITNSIQCIRSDASTKYSVESFFYKLNIDNGSYCWSAEMFEETPLYPEYHYWEYDKLRIFTPNIIKWLGERIEHKDEKDLCNKLSSRPFDDLFTFPTEISGILHNINNGINLLQSVKSLENYILNNNSNITPHIINARRT